MTKFADCKSTLHRGRAAPRPTELRGDAWSRRVFPRDLVRGGEDRLRAAALDAVRRAGVPTPRRAASRLSRVVVVKRVVASAAAPAIDPAAARRRPVLGAPTRRRRRPHVHEHVRRVVVVGIVRVAEPRARGAREGDGRRGGRARRGAPPPPRARRPTSEGGGPGGSRPRLTRLRWCANAPRVDVLDRAREGSEDADEDAEGVDAAKAQGTEEREPAPRPRRPRRGRSGAAERPPPRS